MPPDNRDMMSEADMDDMLGLLDSCLSSSLPFFGINGFGGALPMTGYPDDQTAPITKKQLRALGKEHLLTMLRDCEKELLQEKEKYGHLLLACQAVCQQRK